MIIVLKPINSRFKRLINDFGDMWKSDGEPRSMVCFNGKLGVNCRSMNDPRKVSNFIWDEVK